MSPKPPEDSKTGNAENPSRTGQPETVRSRTSAAGLSKKYAATSAEARDMAERARNTIKGMNLTDGMKKRLLEKGIDLDTRSGARTAKGIKSGRSKAGNERA